MRAGPAIQHDTLLRRFQRDVTLTHELGLRGLRFDDVGDGSTIRVDGRVLANFGNCSYLGINLDPRLKAGAIEATERFGPLYSSSQAYAGVALYEELADRFRRMTGAPAVVLPPTTTLGHMAVLPTLVGAGDVVVVDSHSHASLQLTTQVLAGRGIPIRAVPHSHTDELARTLDELEVDHRHIWYLADGVYSMFGDVAPVEVIGEFMERYPNLYCYFDDAHGFSWYGLHGRGYVLSHMEWSERLVLAMGLSKSFGSGGAVLAFGDPEMARRVDLLGGPMNFSGPIHPPTLGAMLASTEIHLSTEHFDLRRRMSDQIDLVSKTLAHHGLPVVSWARTPVWLVKVGEVHDMLEVGRRLLDDGFFINVAGFPLVPAGMAGIRLTHTLNNTDVQIQSLAEALSHHLRAVVGEVDSSIDLTELEAG